MRELKDYIRSIKDFPKDGIIFRDVTSMLQDPEGLQLSIKEIQKGLENLDCNIVVSPE